MRQLLKIATGSNYRLICVFDDGTEKVADITQYLHSEVFSPLKDTHLFDSVKNRQYYVEWLDGEIDLSADTLWHIGDNVSSDL